MNHELPILPMASAVSRQGTGHGTLCLATFDAVYIFPTLLPTSCIFRGFLGAATLGAHDDNLFHDVSDVSSCFISFICCIAPVPR